MLRNFLFLQVVQSASGTKIFDWQSGVIVCSDEKSVTLEDSGEKSTVLFEDIAKAKFVHL